MSPLSYVLISSSYNFGDLISCLGVQMPPILVEFTLSNGGALLLDSTTVVPANRIDMPLDGGHSMKISGMWTFKHEIGSPKFYELLIKTELKGDTDMDLKNFYNNINICPNAENRL